MTILVDARPLLNPPHGGIPRVTLEILCAYAETYPNDKLLCITTGHTQLQLPSRLTTFSNVTHLHLRIPNKLWSALSFLNLVSMTHAAEQRGHTIDAIFFPNLGFIGRINRPYSLLLHDLSFLIEPRWFSLKSRLWHRAVHARKLIQNATTLFSVSETTKRDAVQLLNIPENRIHVIQMGQTITQDLQTEQTRPTSLPARYVLSMGLNDPRKNVHTVIDAVERLRQEKSFQDLQLIIVGTPERHPTRQHAEWIHIAVHPTDKDLATLYRFASAFAYPSWYEGYGLPLHEAAMYGTPRVASTTGALPETAPEGTIFANPAKPQHWVEAMREAVGMENGKINKTPMNWETTAKTLHDQFKKYQRPSIS